MAISPGEYFAEINGVKLAFHVIGQGPPLIVVAPGWGVGSSYLRRGWLPLTRERSMIFLDPRGSGRSDRPRDSAAMSCREMANDIDGIRQILGLDTVDIIGHSHGGAIAIEFAARYPEHVDRMVLVDSQLMGFGAEAVVAGFVEAARDDRRYRRAARHAGLPVPRTDKAFARFLANLLPMYFFNPRPVLAQCLDHLAGRIRADTFHALAAAERALSLNQAAILHQIRSKTLILVGRHDWICPVEVSERIRAGIHSSTIEVFESSGHFPWLEEPEHFFPIVADFLLPTGSDCSGPSSLPPFPTCAM